jgi:hypothetical protein
MVVGCCMHAAIHVCIGVLALYHRCRQLACKQLRCCDARAPAVPHEQL